MSIDYNRNILVVCVSLNVLVGVVVVTDGKTHCNIMEMYMASEDKIQAIGRVLNDQSRPLKERFRALFTLRNLGGAGAIQCIQQCFSDPSALLKHELAYCLGQMQDVRAVPMLKRILSDRNQETMVRHEAGWFF
jgi:deoxyhypusine monooxygenase